MIVERAQRSNVCRLGLWKVGGISTLGYGVVFRERQRYMITKIKRSLGTNYITVKIFRLLFVVVYYTTNPYVYKHYFDTFIHSLTTRILSPFIKKPPFLLPLPYSSTITFTRSIIRERSLTVVVDYQR